MPEDYNFSMCRYRSVQEPFDMVQDRCLCENERLSIANGTRG
jgi:hypothetical protein